MAWRYREKKGTLYYAGACRPNPGQASIGYVIKNHSGALLDVYGDLIDPYPLSSNAAHYRALINGLRRASDLGFTHIVACGHLELISDQLNGVCATRKPNMQRYRRKVRKIASSFEDFQAEYISAEDNSHARSLAQDCL
ncbi:hypothetical protein SUGI_0521920 [Cryptomeria japonica]|uniref:uncharacterized protein LOC131063816 n=1 Tax=Cryptomeria japonica TaxID=3369 RepID=UPI002408A138|nr:uncharacterized protein LOC131063816 [Cryptomeria japonica]GLJ26771.1 hypothetical protein SUGI_0521920 [Cryptomeria japonica]